MTLSPAAQRGAASGSGKLLLASHLPARQTNYDPSVGGFIGKTIRKARGALEPCATSFDLVDNHGQDLGDVFMQNHVGSNI